MYVIFQLFLAMQKMVSKLQCCIESAWIYRKKFDKTKFGQEMCDSSSLRNANNLSYEFLYSMSIWFEKIPLHSQVNR